MRLRFKCFRAGKDYVTGDITSPVNREEILLKPVIYGDAAKDADNPKLWDEAPNADLIIRIDKATLQGQVQPGKDYWIDITPIVG